MSYLAGRNLAWGHLAQGCLQVGCIVVIRVQTQDLLVQHPSHHIILGEALVGCLGLCGGQSVSQSEEEVEVSGVG